MNEQKRNRTSKKLSVEGKSSVIQYQLNQKHEKNLLYMVLFIGGFNPSIRVYMNAVRFVKEILNFQITACLLQ